MEVARDATMPFRTLRALRQHHERPTGRDLASPQDFAHPALVDGEHGQRRAASWTTRPRRDDQPAVLEDADRHVFALRARRVSSTIVRRASVWSWVTARRSAMLRIRSSAARRARSPDCRLSPPCARIAGCAEPPRRRRYSEGLVECDTRIRSELGEGSWEIVRAHRRCIVPSHGPSCRRTIGNLPGEYGSTTAQGGLPGGHGERGPRVSSFWTAAKYHAHRERPERARREVGWGRR